MLPEAPKIDQIRNNEATVKVEDKKENKKKKRMCKELEIFHDYPNNHILGKTTKSVCTFSSLGNIGPNLYFYLQVNLRPLKKLNLIKIGFYLCIKK